MSRTGVVSAFGWIEGHLFFGPNHLEIATQAFDAGLLSADQLPTPEYMDKLGPMAWGWIWQNSDGSQEAEFYSDFAQYAQSSDIFEKVFHQIQKKYPKCTEMTMGPDEDTIKEMSTAFD